MITNSPVIQSWNFILHVYNLLPWPASCLPALARAPFLTMSPQTATTQINTADVDTNASSLDISAVMLNYGAEASPCTLPCNRMLHWVP